MPPSPLDCPVKWPQRIVVKVIVDRVIIIGRNSSGSVIFSEDMSRQSFYSDLHIWDSMEDMKQFGIRTISGFIFDDTGRCEQEFNNSYDHNGGIIGSISIRNESKYNV